jgi:Cu-Zn family superoxide dismutase
MVAVLGACTKDDDTAESAVAELTDSSGQRVGEATLTKVGTGIQVQFTGHDLPPGIHGFHIHETGKCDAPSFESAGGHFNPTNMEHGLDNPDGPHFGDLPNLEVAADGTVETRAIVDGANLETSDARSLLAGDGTALVIHRDLDDGHTDPAGNAGPRIACGVIKAQ